MRRRIFSLLAIIALLGSLSIIAFAHEIPALESGSITIHVRYGENGISGGSLSIFHVGNIEENDGNFYFVGVPGLPETQISINETDNPQLAVELKEIALNQDNNIAEQTAAIQDGVATFPVVEPGLYVVVQKEASPGYMAMGPFLISMPRRDENGKYVNTVEASPKVPLETEPTEEPEDPTPTKPKDPTLPQTGQLNWPVPVLAVAGLILFAAGCLLYSGRRRDN